MLSMDQDNGRDRRGDTLEITHQATHVKTGIRFQLFVPQHRALGTLLRCVTKQQAPPSLDPSRSRTAR